MKRILLVLLFALLAAAGIMAQTPGMIYEPATGAGKLVLDPNNDGYVSQLPTGFVTDDQAESEIPFVAFVFPGFEPTSDLGPGPDCGFTDFVDEGDEDPAQYYLDASNNWLFRLRMGNTAPNAKSYSLLIDTDGKFGSSGPNADPDYNSQNPGFEIEIVLATKFGVFVYDVDGIPNCSAVISYPGTTNYQKAIALTTNCGDPDYFYDFFVDFDDLTAQFGITPATPLRIAIIDNMAADKSTLCNPNSASDLGGTDCVGPLENCFQEIIDNYPPCATNGTPCEDRTPCPVITGTYTVGNTIINGTGLAGATVEVFVDGTSGGTTTVTGGGTWTLTLATGLTAGQVVTASQILAPMSLSFTNCSPKTVLNCTGAPVAAPVISSQSGKNFCGTGIVGYDIEVYYPNGTLYPANPFPSLYNPVPADGNWVWKCTGNTGGCNSGSGVDCIYEGGYMIFQVDPNGCMSYPQFTCLDPGGGYATNPGNAPVIVASSVFAGSTSVNVTVTNTTNAGDPASGFIHLFVDGAYWATSSFVSGNGTFAVTCSALPACGTITARYIQSVNSTSANHECFSPASAGVTINQATSAPVLTGPYCTITSITTVTGTSTEADGTQIQVYDNGAPAGAVTTVLNGSWTVTGLNILPGHTITATATVVTCGSQSIPSTGIVVETKSTNAVSITTSPIIEGTTSVTGSGINGDVIALYIDGYQIGATTIVAGGAWTISGLNSYDLYTNGSVTATATTPGFCAGNESVAVPVQCILPAITLTVNPTDTTVCSGSVVANIRVEGSESGIIYQLYNGASTSGASKLGNGGTITLTSATITANTTLTVKAIKLPLGSCTSTLTDNVPVTVNAVPTTTLTVTATSPICENSSSEVQVELSQLNFNYQLKKVSDDSNVGTPVAGTGGTISLPTGALTATTQFKVVATGIAPSYCTGTLATQPTVTVIPGPVAPLSADVDRNNFCSDDAGNISLSVTGGSGSQVGWYTSSCGGTSVGTGNPLSLASPAVTTTYYARWEDGSCYSACQSVTVTVVAIPTAPTTAATDRNNFCADDAGNIALSVTGGAGTQVGWYTSSCGGTSVGTGNPLSIASPASTTTYYARWENGTCYSTCQTVTVTVTPLPTAPTSASATATTICNGNSTTLSYTGGTGTTFAWYTGSCGGTSVGTGNNLSVSPAVTTTYYGRWENGTCYSTCQTVTVTVTALPTAPTSVSATSTSICNGSSTTLSYTGGTGTTFAWYTGSCGGTSVGTGNNLSVSPSATTTYYGRWENGTCYSTCQTVTVTVTALPTAPTSVSATSTSICNGSSTTLSYTGGSGSTFGWYTGSCGGTSVGTGNNLSVSPAVTTTYYGRWENGTCYSTCQTVTVTVTALPTAPTSVSATSTSICNGSSTTLSYTGGTGTTFAWYTGSCGGTSVGTGNNLSVSPAVTTTYYGRWENGTCYSTCQTVTVSVNNGPSSAVISGTATICEGATTPLQITITGGTSPYSVTVNNGVGTINNYVSGTNIPVTPAASTTYLLTAVSDANGCASSSLSGSAVVTVNFCNSNPVANDDNGGTLTEDGSNGTVSVLTNDTDPDGNPSAPTNGVGQFTVDMDPSTAGIQISLTNTDGTWTYDPSTGIVTFDPADNYYGTATVTYELCDPFGACDQAVVTFVVTPVNDPPAIPDNTGTTPEDTPVTICTSFTDADGAAPYSVTLSCNDDGAASYVINPGEVCITYTPDADFNGKDTVCIHLCDAAGACSDAEVVITVTPVNDPPVIDNEYISVAVNGTGSGDLTNAGDSDVDGNLVVNTTPVSGPSNGGIVINADGTYTYTPTAGYTGSDQVVVQICDDGTPLPVICVNDTIFITVLPTNPPVANNDNSNTVEDTPVTFNVTGNDSDSDGTINTATVDLDPSTAGIQSTFTNASGTWAVDASGNVTYTPAADFNGNATVTYTVNDNDGATSNVATITVVVSPVNDPPVVDNEILTTPEDTPVSGDLTDAGDSDVDGNLVVNTTPLDGPSSGGIVINADGTFTYTPNLNFNGNDTVVVEICDDGTPLPAICTNDTIFITITPVNDAPVAADTTISTPEDTPVTVCVPFTDVDGSAPYTATLSCNDDGAASYVINPGEVCITYTPDADFNGNDTVCVNLCDAGGACTDVEVFITVTPVNDPPVANDDVASTSEDTPVTFSITVNDTDIDGTIDPLTIDLDPLTGGTQNTITTTEGIWTIDASGNITFNPALDFNGIATLTYTVNDNSGATSNIATITVTVNAVNDPPVIDNEYISVAVNGSGSGDLTDAGDSDVDGNLVVNTTPVSGPSNGGIVINADGTYTYTPTPGYTGNDQVVVQICDDGTPLPAICVNDTIFITVLPTNPPVANDDNSNTAEDTPVTFNVTGNDTDSDGTINTASVDLDPSSPGIQSSFTNAYGTWTVDASGNVTFDPATDFNGTATVTYTVNDNDGATSNVATITVVVSPVNDPPVVDNEIISTPEDTPVSGDLTDAGDSDVDGNLVVNTTPLDGPSSGGIVINADGTFTYTPNLNFNGNDTVVVEICDDGTPLPALCVNDTIFITVTPVNDPPVATDTTISTPEDTPVTVCVPFTDADGSAPYTATLSCNDDGSASYVINPGEVCITYTPDADFNGNDTVCVNLCDAGGACTDFEVFISITPVNDPPVTANEYESIDEDVTLSGTILTPADTDPDGDNLTVSTTPVAGPDNGTIIVNSDGSYSYTPDPGFTGNDMIVLEVCDDGSPVLCSFDTLFITVNPVNDAPVAVNDVAGTDPGIPVDINVGLNDSDEDGPTLTWTIITAPDSGSAVINGSIITYTPNPGVGTSGQVIDTLWYEVCDNGTPNLCDTAMVVIYVPNVPLPPVVTNEHVTGLEDTPLVIDVTANDYDPNGDPLTVTPGSGTTPNGSWLVDVNGDIVYTPNPDFNGNDTIIVQVCDPTPNCINDTIFIVIDPVNDPPVVTNDTATTLENTPVAGILIGAGETDPDGTTLLANTNPVSGPSNGNIVINNDGSFIYTPDNGFVGEDTVVVEICDNGIPQPPICVFDTLFITINPSLPPSIPDTTVTTPQDSTITFCLDITDPENNGPYSVGNIDCADLGNVSAVVNGTEVCITYVPTAGITGTDTLCITLCDAAGSCATYEPVVIIIPPNDPPVIPDTTVTTPQDSTITFCLDITDTEGDVPYTVSNINCADLGNVSAVVNGTEVCITYVPTAGVTGTDTLCITLCDAAGSCATYDPVVVIIPPNDPPVIPDTTVTTPQDSTITFCLDITDTEGDVPYTVSNINCADLGNVSAVVNGTEVCITYVPTAGVTGTDTLCITLCDAAGSCETYEPVVIIIPPNDPPVIPDTTVTTPMDSTITFCLDITDTEGDVPYTVANINCADLGNVSAVVNGTEVCITYVPMPGVTGTDTLCITLCDAAGSCETYNPVVIIVPDINTPPYIADTTITTPQDSLVTLCVDIMDAEGNDPYTATVGCEDNGTVSWVIFENQLCITYQPDSGFTGTDSLCVVICDAAGACDTSVVVVVVIPTVNVLIANPDFRTTKTNTPVTITILDNDTAPNSTFDLSSINVTQYPINGSVIINSNGTATYTPDAYYTGTDVFVYNVCNNDFNPACDTAKVTIVIEPNDLSIPTGFSPDKDGVNETFVITGIEMYPEAILKIYNRWGNLVYESEIPYRNDWDGTSNVRGVAFGTDLPEATYFYLLETGTDEKPFSGYVILKRNQ